MRLQKANSIIGANYCNYEKCNSQQSCRQGAYFMSIIRISLPKPMFGHLLELYRRDDSCKCSNIRFGEKITQEVSIEVYFSHLIWITDTS